MLLAVMQAWAQSDTVSADVNRSTEERLSERATLVARHYGQVTANRYFQYGTSLSTVSAGWKYRYEKNAIAVWRGNRASTGLFSADSYLRFGGKSAAFIGAEYENGILDNVNWNSTADYELLCPYVLISPATGKVHHERYSFSGGCASRFGRWVSGISGSYRALHEFQRIDPRPRSKVNDLKIEASLSRMIGRNYALGAAADIRIYKQTMDVSYFNEAGAFTPQYHYIGLGQTFGRFDGTTYTETRHKGFGYGFRMSLVPTGSNGFLAAFDYSRLKMNRQLHEINEAPITVLWTDRCEANLAYIAESNAWDYTLSLCGNYERRQGEEAVVDNGLMGEFKILDRHTMYDRHRYCATLNAVAEWHHDHHCITIASEAQVEAEKEQYRDPVSVISHTSLNAGIHAGYRRLSGLWLFSATVSGDYHTCPANRFSISSSVMQELSDLLSYTRLRIMDDCFVLQPRLSVQRRLQQAGAIFISLLYRQLFHSYGVSLAAEISLGYRF